MSSSPMFEPLKIGPINLSHRVVMAPLTRMRADLPGGEPNEMNARYYGQRSTKGGLIIAEASQVMPGGRLMAATPGCYSQEQTAGWARVVDEIHAKGAYAYLQLWHVGRLSHSSYQVDGGPPFAPSPIKASGKARTADGTTVDREVPRAMNADEIATTVRAYADAARNARQAGFDGVEVHAANGYLLEQFLQSTSNQRDDEYGGSIENRSRLILEITAAVVDAVGADRTGIRLSPFGVANDSGEADPEPLYRYLVRELNKHKLAYLHLLEPRASGAGQAEVDHKDMPSAATLFRKDWDGVLITAGNFRGDSANQIIASGDADAVAFGRLFISNPDLPERLRINHELTPYNRATFYTRGEEGYTDYPGMDKQTQVSE